MKGNLLALKVSEENIEGKRGEADAYCSRVEPRRGRRG